MKTPQTKSEQKKRLLLVLPLLILPFITFGFWALGGGKSEAAATGKEHGLNTNLPDAHNSNALKDKLSYYEKTLTDSLHRKEQGENDPYFKAGQPVTPPTGAANTLPGYPGNAVPGGYGYHDSNETKVYEKLGALQKALNQPVPANTQPAYIPGGYQQPVSVNTSDVDRLEQMMKAMQAGSTQKDPETEQLNTMLEKILDIQHPDRVQEKINEKQAFKKGQVYVVSTPAGREKITTLEVKTQSGNKSGFYGLDDSIPQADEHNAIGAVIHEDQTIVAGSTVKLRLTDAIQINGVTIPKDNFVFGTASLDGERLVIEIKSITYQKSIYPVQLSVFDVDGLDGIYIPGAITRDVAKQNADQSIQNIGLTSYEPSLGVQAASAGIEAAKSLLSKKIKLIKVFVKAGYKVLLRDDKQRQGNQ